MSYYESDQSGWFSGNAGDADYGQAAQQYGGYSNQQQDYGGGYSQDQQFYGGGGSYYGSASQDMYSGQMFMPSVNQAPATDNVSFEDEPPLLEELGINFDHIRQKTLAVLNPLQTKPDQDAIVDQDLAGPLVFCLLFGGALLLHGKVHFGYIYGIGVLGCLAMYSLLNLMSQGGISITLTCSVLGYCLLPMALLSLVAAVFSFKGGIGMVLSGLAVLWCSNSASKLFVTALNLDHQQLLVAYPCSLLYGVFALLAIF